MVNGIRTIYIRILNKGFGLKFCVGFRVRHETSKEGQRVHRLKRCEYNNKDTSPNTLNNKNFIKVYDFFKWNEKMRKIKHSIYVGGVLFTSLFDMIFFFFFFFFQTLIISRKFKTTLPTKKECWKLSHLYVSFKNKFIRPDVGLKKRH